MGMSVGNKKGGGFSDINVTPLIDIVLVVLIIFMVITPQTIDELAVNMPKKTETIKQPEDQPDQLVLSVCEDGSFALNAIVMPEDALRDQLRRRLAATQDKVVFFDSHPEAPYEKVVALMDEARRVGAQRVGIARLKDADKFKGCTPPDAPAAPTTGG